MAVDTRVLDRELWRDNVGYFGCLREHLRSLNLAIAHARAFNSATKS